MNRVPAVPECAWRRLAWAGNDAGVIRCLLPIAAVISFTSVASPSGAGPGTAPSAPYMVTFSPDGLRLAVATGKPDSKVALTVWDTATLRRLWVVRHRQGIPAVAFAPDGETLAIGCFGGEAKVYDSVAGKLRATYGGHGTVARAVGFAPDGRLLAVGSYEGFIKLVGSDTRNRGAHLTRPQRPHLRGGVFAQRHAAALGRSRCCSLLWDVTTGQIAACAAARWFAGPRRPLRAGRQERAYRRMGRNRARVGRRNRDGGLAA